MGTVETGCGCGAGGVKTTGAGAGIGRARRTDRVTDIPTTNPVKAIAPAAASAGVIRSDRLEGTGWPPSKSCSAVS